MLELITLLIVNLFGCFLFCNSDNTEKPTIKNYIITYIVGFVINYAFINILFIFAI